MFGGLCLILWYEVLLPLSVLGLAVLSMYNRYHKLSYETPEICYTRNMQFLQNLIDQIAKIKSGADGLIQDYLFWGNPKLSMATLKVTLFSWPAVYIALMYLPLRYFVAVGWCGFFIYMSDFGSRLCYALYRTIQTRIDDFLISRNSSLQVAEETSAR